MGFRFRRSMKLMPGVRMNFSKSGASLSLGGPGATVNLSSRGTRRTIGIPGTGLSYSEFSSATGGYRRQSSQQIAAAHRRMMQEQNRETAQRDVDRLEAELQETLNAWRNLPPIPTAQEFEQTLVVQAFANQESPPPLVDLDAEQTVFRRQLSVTVRAEHPRGLLSRFGWIVAAVVTVLFFRGNDIGFGFVAGAVIGLGAWGIARAVWLVRLSAVVDQRMTVEWSLERDRLETGYRDAVDAHAAREAEVRERWLTSEQDRIAEGRRLLAGQPEAVERAVSAGVADLDFPFEAECAVGIDEEDHATIDVDLPEIEDVIPETRYTVLKNGTLKEVKRKAVDRNEGYAFLVTGIAFTVAATAFASAPTLRFVTVAGHTQRKSRLSLDVDDTYVYEVRFHREALNAISVGTLDPIEAIRGLPSRIDAASNGTLKKIPNPKWAAALSE